MAITTPEKDGSKVKLKKEQHPLSRAARSDAAVRASDASVNSNRVLLIRVRPDTESRNNTSNSATRNGRSALGNEHDSGAHFAASPILMTPTISPYLGTGCNPETGLAYQSDPQPRI